MELSEEEKKAIESIKNDMKLLYGEHNIVSNEDLKILLQLLEKQSKEIEDLKDKINTRIEEIEKIYPDDTMFTKEFLIVEIKALLEEENV